MAQRRSQLTPQFSFDDAVGQFRHIASGKFVSREQVRGAVDGYLKSKTDEVRVLAEQLRAREISLKTFQTAMESNIAKIHLANAAAKGGWQKLNQSDFGRVGQLVKAELGGVKDVHRGLRGFVKDIEGGLPLDGRFMQRAKSYAQSGRHTFHLVDRLEQAARGMSEERSIRHVSDSCEECVSVAARRWQPVGTLPLPGARICQRNCKCRMEYRQSGERRSLISERNVGRIQESPNEGEKLSDKQQFVHPLPERVQVSVPRFKSAKEAEKWAAERGVKADYKKQMHLANFASRALAEIEELNLPLPDEIKADFSLIGKNEPHTPAATIGRRIFINPNATYWKNNGGEAHKKARQQAVNNYWSTSHVLHPLRHEFGHSIPSSRGSGMNWDDVLIARLSGRISDRALESPSEFVSEVFAAIMNNQRIDVEVMRAYEELGGPSPSGGWPGLKRRTA